MVVASSRERVFNYTVEKATEGHCCPSNRRSSLSSSNKLSHWWVEGFVSVDVEAHRWEARRQKKKKKGMTTSYTPWRLPVKAGPLFALAIAGNNPRPYPHSTAQLRGLPSLS